MSVSQRDKIKQITRKYIGLATLEQASRDTGSVITRQQMWLYKSGRQRPTAETCTAILKSPKSTPAARDWARECLTVVLPDAEVTVNEPEIDRVS